MNDQWGTAEGALDMSESLESTIARRSEFFVLLAGGLFLALLLAGAIIPIAGAVVGMGQLGVESRVKRIAHPSGGVISQILVRDGDRVRKGDILVRLDTNVAGVRADLTSRTADQLRARRARLEAEREGRDDLRFPYTLSKRAPLVAQEAMATELRLFRLRANERRGLKAQFAQRIIQFEEQVKGYSAQIDALRKQQALIEPERKGLQQLWEKGLVTIGRRNQLERAAADIEGTIAALGATIAETRARISEVRQQLIQVDQSTRADAGTELAQLDAALNQQQFEEVSATDSYSRSEIRAPYDGVVDKMAFASGGEVIQPAETIMEIVPDTDRLIVEARVSPADIDQVRVGQAAWVRLTTYAAQSTPELAGRVAFVSVDAVNEGEAGSSYYRVKVELDARGIAAEKLRLVPGMPAEIFISTGSRSMLSYLVRPLADQFARVFRN